MTVIKRRDRIVVFRLTEEEYEGLRQDCEAKGGRSLSEFARSELLASSRPDEITSLHELLVSTDQRISTTETRCAELERRMAALELARIGQALKSQEGVAR